MNYKTKALILTRLYYWTLSLRYDINSYFKDYAVLNWNHWFDECLTKFLKLYSPYRKNHTFIVFRCRTPYTYTSKVYGVWLPPNRVIDLFNEFDFSELRIILGPKLVRRTFETVCLDLQNQSFLTAPLSGSDSGRVGQMLTHKRSKVYYLVFDPKWTKTTIRGKYIYYTKPTGIIESTKSHIGIFKKTDFIDLGFCHETHFVGVAEKHIQNRK